MFVGEAGIGRVVQRAAELMKAGKDPRACGAIDLPMLQRYLNLWYAVSLDLFGAEVSTNAANYFGAGLKGRPKEEKFPDHLLLEGISQVELYEDGKLTTKEVSPRLAINQSVRAAYTADCQKAVDRWNRHLEGMGVALTLPSPRFHRNLGTYMGACFDPAGNVMSEAEFERHAHDFLPSASDREYVHSLMAHPVQEAGHFANWIAPPARGIDSKPVHFEYVRYNEEV